MKAIQTPDARAAFLSRIRTAVAAGNHASHAGHASQAAALPERGRVGYQGAGQDLAARFCQELANAGGQGHLAPTPDSAWEIIDAVLQTHQPRNFLLGHGGMLDQVQVAQRLAAREVQVQQTGGLRPAGSRDLFFAADVGISNVYRLIAETGTVVMRTAPEDPRSLSLLPPVHIALAHHSQLLPDLFDLFDLFAPTTAQVPPACLTLITGPSKTGDIELKLVTGVHGPGEIHVIIGMW